MNAAGACSKGTPSSFGAATIVQRGSVVVISQAIGTTVIGGAAGGAELSTTAPYALSALKLLAQVGLS
jgi:hypothetical protein